MNTPAWETAVIVVDLQNDFCPGGSLAVANGDKIVPIANDILAIAKDRRIPVFASRCWHPPDHCSFKEQGGPWPAHCVQSTKGAELHPELKLRPGKFTLVSKGTEQNKDAYSAFDGTDLEKQLRKKGITKLWMFGLATDYCVKATALDAKKLGFEVVVIANACASVNLDHNDGNYALNEMQQAGVKITTFDINGL